MHILNDLIEGRTSLISLDPPTIHEFDLALIDEGLELVSLLLRLVEVPGFEVHDIGDCEFALSVLVQSEEETIIYLVHVLAIVLIGRHQPVGVHV